ncbi:ABC transporter permease subunit [Prescottella defluvii]|nr:ABC transporter permease subunit [Prescottella defluvii]
MTTPPTSPRRRIAAFAKRAWLQQRTTALWLALIVGGAFGVLAFAATGGVNGVQNLQDIIPSQAADLVSIRDTDGELQTMTSYMLLMAPAILGTLVAMVATLTLPGVVADDVSGGGIEVLLASPIPRRALFSAYLGASLILTAASWIVATLSFAVTAAATTLFLGLSFTLTIPYFAALAVLPCRWACGQPPPHCSARCCIPAAWSPKRA